MADAPDPNPLQPLLDEAQAIIDRMANTAIKDLPTLSAQYGERLKHLAARVGGAGAKRISESMARIADRLIAAGTKPPDAQ